MAQGPRVGVLATGGSISSRGTRGSSYPALTGDQLMGGVPEAPRPVVVEDAGTRQSSELTPADMASFVRRAATMVEQRRLDGVVITHGTALLAETAFVAELLWHVPAGLVLTGAMLRADSPASDGPGNIGDAISAAADPTLGALGPLVVLSEQIHGPLHLQKTHNSFRDAFSSAPFGPVGYLDGGRPYLHAAPARRSDATIAARLGSFTACVPIVQAYSGMDVPFLELFAGGRYDGLVVGTFPGRGGLPPMLFAPITRLLSTGCPVVLANRAAGRIDGIYGGHGHSTAYLDAGARSAGDLTPEQARLLLLGLVSGGAVADIDPVLARIGGEHHGA